MNRTSYSALTAGPKSSLASVFARVLVGTDGSPEAREAARQAAILAERPPTLMAVYDTASGLIGGTGSQVPVYYDEPAQRQMATEAVEQARTAVGEAASGLVTRGVAWKELILQSEREHATVIAVGSHGTGRALGIAIGSIATELIHKAPSSVLVARQAGDAFPDRVVVGVDGSPESAAAYAVADALARRFGARLRTVVALDSKDVDVEAAAAIVGPDRDEVLQDPVRALVATASQADLLVVGSRGLGGLKSLGSVGERVAHKATCSVLLVRRAPWQEPL